MTDDKQAKKNSQAKEDIHDPRAAEEAQRYDNPVASREALLILLERHNQPMTHAQVCEALGEDDDERVEALRRRLIAMCRDGQLISNRRNQFMPIDKTDVKVGKVMGHRDGFGFVLQDEGDDVFLSNRQMRKVFHGDKVAVQILGLDRRGRPEGKIVDVLERNTERVVGRYFEQSGVGVVQPDNKRIVNEILVPDEGRNGAEHNQFVVIQITQQPSGFQLPSGHIVEVLGEHLAPGMEIDVAVRSHNIPHEWPSEVTKEAETLAETVAEHDKRHRFDCRSIPFVTIDGEDARDFDDAVYAERNKRTGGWRLMVAIADVSHYVRVRSALDQEAHNRGNSVYFPGHVVPMLPERLSNGLCSLNPEVDRLVMVCEMTISKAGRISGYHFKEAVIHSHARLTYSKVWKMLQPEQSTEAAEEGLSEGEQWRQHYAEVLPHIRCLYDLFKQLRSQREQRGAMDFDSVETRILFDAERKIQDIVPTERNDAHMLIEECMLAANVCAADFFKRYEIPALYRVHAGPSAEKLENLRSFLGEMGLSLQASQVSKKDPSPKDYQALLQQIEQRPDSHLIQTVLLRSLSQAVYDPDNAGHFGLAYKAYTHFTSPIRRYPDLLVHRGIRSMIRSQRECAHVQRVESAKEIPAKDIYPYDLAAMMAHGEHCSMTERRADDATRDVSDFLKCEYIREYIGEDFAGVITAVTGFGLFVELKDIYVEGLIHISHLQNDYYQFDPVKHRLTGERTRRSFRLGDTVWVRVAGVDLDDRKVDFELTTAPSSEKSSDSRRSPLDRTAPKTPSQRMPRRRAAGSQAGKPMKATSATSADKEGASTSSKKKKTTAKNATKGKKKPSKRQRLNAKKNGNSVTKKVAKKTPSKKKPSRKK